MHDPIASIDRAEGLRVAVIVSRYHHEITDALRRGAVQAFRAAGGREADLLLIEAPGTFELPVLAEAAASHGELDAIVALGCVVTGETSHDRYLADAVAHGLTQVAVKHRLPCAFGVLTVQSLEQARDRAGGDKGNKGAEAMSAAIRAACAIRALEHAEVPD